MRCVRPAISSLVLLAACGVQRPVDFPAICPTYETAVRPIVVGRCGGCHSAANHEGDYVVGAYADTVSRSADGTPRIAAGEASSPFLQAVRGELTSHDPVRDTADAAKLTDWVVRCRAASHALEYHPNGWATPTDAKFHGAALRASFYDFGTCRQCHGEDLRGGKSQVDCNSCHSEGALGCNTCHGDATSAAPPRDLKGARSPASMGVGAHRAHVTGAGLGCGTCHLDVKKATDEGHYRRGGVFLTGPAEVTLKAGFWNRSKATCEQTTCHAPFPADTAPTKKDPVWTTAGGLDCGSCHGAPPSSHASGATPCATCHPSSADGGVAVATHLDGKVDLKGSADRCDSCHSGPGAKKFLGLDGKPKGAHDAHLTAGTLRGPLGCDECHAVPATLLAPGHLDAPPADVFPKDLGGLAWKFGVTPAFDRASGTCTSYCHGSGNFGHPDTAPGLARSPAWDGGTAQAACGTCHGLPPVDGTVGHAPTVGLPCATCHSSVQPDGGIVFIPLPDGGFTSKHLDGKITGP